MAHRGRTFFTDKQKPEIWDRPQRRPRFTKLDQVLFNFIFIHHGKNAKNGVFNYPRELLSETACDVKTL